MSDDERRQDENEPEKPEEDQRVTEEQLNQNDEIPGTSQPDQPEKNDEIPVPSQPDQPEQNDEGPTPSQPDQPEQNDDVAGKSQPEEPTKQNEGEAEELQSEKLSEKPVEDEIKSPDTQSETKPKEESNKSKEIEQEKKEDEPEENIHKRKKPEVVTIPSDFYYEYNEFVSQPLVTEESGLPIDLVKLTYSAGFDCCKRDNLILLTPDDLCFVAGNFVQFLHISDGSFQLLRSLSGDGVGCLAVHPSKKYLAVGEKCCTEAPVIAIYEYPSVKLYRLLRLGTERAYSYCQYNTSGELLASVGSDPDFMLTVWSWENEQIVLRTKAFSQDIYRVNWSADLEGILATSGSGHIKFWKMADTFTGLKLQGHIGKFGKTEISDIEGFVILPDGKVLSGCEWGNMLVWDGDLIKVQIGRKNKKRCHQSEINQVVIEEGELMTVGKDGWIKTWDFETIDTAEVAEEMAVFEMEPMNEVEIAPDANLMHIVKSTEPESSIWYAQDAGGKLWKLDLSFSHTSAPPQVISSYHAGKIVDCDVSPLSYLSASLGIDGSIRVFDFASKTLMGENKYPSGGSKILWAPLKVDPKGKTIIGGFADGVIRILYFTEILEIDISKKSKFKGEITLIQALKPHTKKVTALCTDDKGKILITGSEDETVFFFSISTPEYYPVGFVKLTKPVRHIDWKGSNADIPDEGLGRILVYMDDGEVAEIICPKPQKVDTSHTYEIRELAPIDNGIFKFVSVKSALRHEEELEIKRKEEEKHQEELAKIRRERLERGLDTEEEQQKQIEEDERRRAEEAALEAEWTPYIPEEPSPILFGYIDPNVQNTFWLSMGGYDTGYLYLCEFANSEKKAKMRIPDKYNEPVVSKRLPQSNDVPVTCLKWSKSGMRVIMGLDNGSIRLQTVDKPFDLNTLASCWQFSMHDNNYGSINSICLSHDEKFIISVGNDGNFFIYELMDEELQQSHVEDYRARLPSASIPITKDKIDDIDDPNAYSIEEHKQKSEYDRKVKLAQEKKTATLKVIHDLQKQFKQIKDQNETLPERIRFPEKVFELVPELRTDLMLMKDKKIDLVHKQMAFDSEKCRLALEKLEKRFRDPLESDLLEVHAIFNDHTVSTIRGCKLSDEYYSVVDELEKIRLDLALQNAKDDFNLGDKVVAKQNELDERSKHDDMLSKVNLRGARGMRVARQMKKLDENKRKRAFRKQQWDALFSEKPEENYVDPKDIAAIEEAETNMGDFKLKNSKDYFIPEKDRPNTFKARAELVNLANTIYQRRFAFNEKVKNLLADKINIIEEVNVANEKIQIFNDSSKGPLKQLLPKIILYPTENPEKKFEYTKESLLEFKKEMEEKKKATLQGEDHKQQFTSFTKSNMDSMVGAKPSGLKIARAIPGHSQLPHQMQGSTIQEDSTLINPVSETSSSGAHDNLGALQISRNRETVNLIRWEFETDQILQKTLKKIRIFDTNLRLLRHERAQLGLELQRAILRKLTVFEEYRLLKMYEKSEFGLTEKTRIKMAEKLDINNKLQECQVKSENKKKDIEKLIERDKLNFEKFKESLGENNKFGDYLLKVYKKKIKRRKKETEGDDDDSDESSDSDDSELDESEENSDEDSVVYDLDMCPPNCNQELYDGTCQLRELRLDIEEELVEEKRIQEALRKELDGLSKKLKVVESGLIQAKKELEEFQMEKQHKLNQLKTCVILSLLQILYHENGGLPSNMEKALIFEASKYRALKMRIHRLNEEERQQLRGGKEVKQRYTKLQQNKRLFQKKITETQEECDEMMKTKFGKLDNLEKMEQVMINPKIEELTFKMLELQEDMYNEQSGWEDRIRDAQELCITETKTNTCILNNMLTLYTDRERYEILLDSKQKKLGSEYQLSGPAAEEELSKLNQLVQLQTNELEALKEEIGMLSRKGGHILPPVTQCNHSNMTNDNDDIFGNRSHTGPGATGILDLSDDDREEVEGDDEEEEEEYEEGEKEDEEDMEGVSNANGRLSNQDSDWNNNKIEVG